jgi:hypothetical protein
VEFARSSGRNEFPYGTAEHFGYELRRKFGLEVGMWAVLFCYRERSVAHFLAVVLDKFGLGVAQFGAMYLDKFDELPKLMDQTRDEIVLSKLDFDADSDPDLRRWEDNDV